MPRIRGKIRRNEFCPFHEINAFNLKNILRFRILRRVRKIERFFLRANLALRPAQHPGREMLQGKKDARCVNLRRCSCIKMRAYFICTVVLWYWHRSGKCFKVLESYLKRLWSTHWLCQVETESKRERHERERTSVNMRVFGFVRECVCEWIAHKPQELRR